MQGGERTEGGAAEGAELHKAAIEAYLEQTAIKQAEKEMQRQQMLAPPDAAANFAPAVGEFTCRVKFATGRTCTVSKLTHVLEKLQVYAQIKMA